MKLSSRMVERQFVEEKGKKREKRRKQYYGRWCIMRGFLETCR